MQVYFKVMGEELLEPSCQGEHPFDREWQFIYEVNYRRDWGRWSVKVKFLILQEKCSTGLTRMPVNVVAEVGDSHGLISSHKLILRLPKDAALQVIKSC